MLLARRTQLLPALLFISAPLHAQGMYAGVLVDAKTAAPLPCVDVSLEDSSAHEVAHAQTASDGVFQFDSPAKGSYRPRFSVWFRAPVYGAYETLEPTTERARTYEVDFGEEIRPTRTSWSDTTDSPPGNSHFKFSRNGLKYPKALKDTPIDGDVTVRYAVDSAGRVVWPSIVVLRSSRPEFAAEVVKYLHGALITPARRASRPVCAMVISYGFTFGVR
ncbi:MAG: energy transducer TonB [Gemmatimonadetes bacterium]|nr:energy transducer TonB [Gemmatimonadota bacterium]